MTKQDLVKAIAEETGIENVKVLAVIESLMNQVKKATVEGEDIFLRGLCTITTKVRKEKVGRNIGKNTAVIVPEHKIPYVKPCNEWKEMLK
ncbi:MAG: integration host factor subunit beta [Bacteroidaceae bacterium]|nr:integration host factor subunit beta [Bacteroidaceae bacterium]